MATDVLGNLQSSVTKTATFNSTGLDLKVGTPRRGIWAKVNYSAAATSAGAGSMTFRITESSDNSTFTGIYQPTSATVTLSTTAASGTIYIPINTSYQYVRLELSAISGTGATVTYDGKIVQGWP
jgi:hypothetical protein